jgi:hypothetical protein
MEPIPWTRVKFGKSTARSGMKKPPARSGMKTVRKPRLSVVFKEPAPRSKKQIYQYIVVKPVEPVSVRAGDIDRNDPESMAPRHFKLTPGMMLTSRTERKSGISVGYITFGLIHRADGNAHNRTYDVTVHADTVGEEILPFNVKDYLRSLTSRPPAGSVAPPHPSRVPSGNSGGGRTRRKRRHL